MTPRYAYSELEGWYSPGGHIIDHYFIDLESICGLRYQAPPGRLFILQFPFDTPDHCRHCVQMLKYLRGESDRKYLPKRKQPA